MDIAKVNRDITTVTTDGAMVNIFRWFLGKTVKDRIFITCQDRIFKMCLDRIFIICQDRIFIICQDRSFIICQGIVVQTSRRT